MSAKFVDGVGQVELEGELPFNVHQVGNGGYDIRDATGRVISRHAYARSSVPNAIVAAFNADHETSE